MYWERKGRNVSSAKIFRFRSHIAATHLLGLYFMANRSFNREERGRISNLEDFNSAIHYYEKAARMIEETNSYPKGTTEDMEEIEYYVYTSYYVFATAPELYFIWLR